MKFKRRLCLVHISHWFKVDVYTSLALDAESMIKSFKENLLGLRWSSFNEE